MELVQRELAEREEERNRIRRQHASMRQIELEALAKHKELLGVANWLQNACGCTMREAGESKQLALRASKKCKELRDLFPPWTEEEINDNGDDGP